jgi:quinoprotein dehydrogenase-associated probable ABC transporter substrate-binding protein
LTLALAILLFVGASGGVSSLVAQEGQSSRVLRVCADPDNMPFSNDKGEGFENKLAELIAAKLNAQLVYSRVPDLAGTSPNRPLRDACDLVMGYAQGTGLVEDTNPYYRTSYALIYRQDDASLAGVDQLSDPRLKSKRIGVFDRTPPVSILAAYGLNAEVKPFAVSGANGAKGAEDLIDEIAEGKIDAALIWGPIGGYFAQWSPVPLAVVPLSRETVGPRLLFDITMGVRPAEPEWKQTLNKLIAENQTDINSILSSFRVPLLDEKGNPIKPGMLKR